MFEKTGPIPVCLQFSLSPHRRDAWQWAEPWLLPSHPVWWPTHLQEKLNKKNQTHNRENKWKQIKIKITVLPSLDFLVWTSPAQFTTHGVSIVPWGVSTAFTRLTPRSSSLTLTPVTGQFSITWSRNYRMEFLTFSLNNSLVCFPQWISWWFRV